MLKTLLLTLLLCLSQVAFSQFYEEKDRPTTTSTQNTNDQFMGSQMDLGLGLGLDYGNLGVKMNYFLDKRIGFFGGIGTVGIGMGVNVGAIYHLTTNSKRMVPYLSGMYGSNAVIIVENASEYNKIYYGPSFGGGLEIHSRKRPGNFWNVGLYIIGYSSEYRDDLDALKQNPSVSIDDPTALSISVGYHFGLN